MVPARRAPGYLKTMLDEKFVNGKNIIVVATSADGEVTEFPVTVRIDTPQEILYYQHGGILQYVLRPVGGEGEDLRMATLISPGDVRVFKRGDGNAVVVGLGLWAERQGQWIHIHMTGPNDS